MASFNKDGGALIRKLMSQEAQEKVTEFETVAIDGIAGTVDGTPMGIPNNERSPSQQPRGNVQFNWQSGRKVNSRVLTSGGGRDGREFATKAIRGKLGKGKSVYIFNNHPAITTLEYGGYPTPVKKGTYRRGRGYERRSERGFSKLAPKGMVRVGLRRIRTRAAKI